MSIERVDTRYIKIADRNCGGGIMGSIAMLYKVVDQKKVYDIYDRPPFPILIERPTLRDVLGNYKFCDFALFAAFYTFGVLAGFSIGRVFPTMQHKLVIYGGFVHASFVSGISAATYVNYCRLTGYWDNGLRWNVPNYHVIQFDTTSRFEENTFFKRFRIKLD